MMRHQIGDRRIGVTIAPNRAWQQSRERADATTRRWRRRAEARKAVYSTATAVI